jgi:hypothetical protein
MNAGSNAEGSNGSTDIRAPSRVGLTPRGERILNVVGIAVLAAFAIGWSWSIAQSNALPQQQGTAAAALRSVTTAMTQTAGPTAAYVTNAALEALAQRSRGASGKLKAKFALPGAVDDAIKSIANFDLITLLPFSEKKNGRVGLYYIGNWPAERGGKGPSKAPPDRYANPEGFIEVTLDNRDTKVSEHFRLKDFLAHDQPNVWPKYLVLQMRNVDKLELVLEDLQKRGVNPNGVVVMSGFRTPQYNAGGGNTDGRAGLSRHMYGDAADIYIDNDHNGTMDDLNRDGRIDIGDARFIQESVERVEREHPEMLGGAGVYIACCGHGPFIHIDSRGYRARWTGTSGG